MKWQPMPATAREPSGTLVLVLCGQPLQNHGARSPVAVAPLAAAALAEARLLSFASISAIRIAMRGGDVGVDAELAEPLGDRARDDRRRQVGLRAQQPVLARVGLAPLAAAAVAFGLVELAEHARAHVRAPVVELFLQLVFDDLALLLDDEDLLAGLRRSRA